MISARSVKWWWWHRQLEILYIWPLGWALFSFPNNKHASPIPPTTRSTDRPNEKENAHAISGLTIKIICVELFVAISSKFTHPRGSSVGSKVMQFVLYKANKHPKDKEKICFSRFVECFMVVCRLFNEKSLLFSNGSKWTDEWFKYYHYQICNSFEFGRFFVFDLDSFEPFQKPHEISFTLDQMLIGKRW